MKLNEESGKQELSMSKVLDATSEQVFEAWVDPHQMAQWWGPKGYTNPVCELEIRAGGQIWIEMTDPNGKVHPVGGIFQVIVKGQQLVFTTKSFMDAQNNPGMLNLNSVQFQEHVDGKTKLALKVIVVRSTPEMAMQLDRMREGWSQSFDRLARLLEKNEVLVSPAVHS
ncbi:MAG: SRPBCC domain-containing protein [Candidatus Altimarinota bacterium]